MNKLEFYFWSIVDTIGQGLNYVTHYHQYKTNEKVIDSSKALRKRKTNDKVIRHHGRKGRG